MSKVTITVGRSVQVFQIGLPEYWNKITIEKEYDYEIDPQFEIDGLMGLVEKAHGRHSQSVADRPAPKGDIFFNVTTQKEER